MGVAGLSERISKSIEAGSEELTLDLASFQLVRWLLL